MHTFTAALPEHHSITGLRPGARTVLVVCGYYPGQRAYFAWVGGNAFGLSAGLLLGQKTHTVSALQDWLAGLGLGLPGGLATQLRHETYRLIEWPGQQTYWGEQGPEAHGPVLVSAEVLSQAFSRLNAA